LLRFGVHKLIGGTHCRLTDSLTHGRTDPNTECLLDRSNGGGAIETGENFSLTESFVLTQFNQI